MTYLSGIARTFQRNRAPTVGDAGQAQPETRGRVDANENARNWQQRAGAALRTGSTVVKLEIKSALGMKVDVKPTPGPMNAERVLDLTLSTLLKSDGHEPAAYGFAMIGFMKASGETGDTAVTRETIANRLSGMTDDQLVGLSKSLQYNRLTDENPPLPANATANAHLRAGLRVARNVSTELNTEMNGRNLSHPTVSDRVGEHIRTTLNRALNEVAVGEIVSWRGVSAVNKLHLEPATNRLRSNALDASGLGTEAAAVPAQLSQNAQQRPGGIQNNLQEPLL